MDFFSYNPDEVHQQHQQQQQQHQQHQQHQHQQHQHQQQQQQQQQQQLQQQHQSALRPMHNLLNTNTPISAQQSNMHWSTAPNLHNVLTNPQPSALSQPSLNPPVSAPHLQEAPRSNSLILDEDPPINPHVVSQMGGLAFADHCKERARERFKEIKKNEHMAKGDFDRMKRRKKGDTSMTPREKYLRRLKMNQDSAAAARHAQEVYVHVLEKLVRTTEDDKKSMSSELHQLRQENSMLHNKVSHLEAIDRQPLDPSLYDTSRKQAYDPIQVAKLVDMLTAPPTVSAEATDPNFPSECIQPAPAV